MPAMPVMPMMPGMPTMPEANLPKITDEPVGVVTQDETIHPTGDENLNI